MPRRAGAGELQTASAARCGRGRSGSRSSACPRPPRRRSAGPGTRCAACTRSPRARPRRWCRGSGRRARRSARRARRRPGRPCGGRRWPGCSRPPGGQAVEPVARGLRRGELPGAAGGDEVVEGRGGLGAREISATASYGRSGRSTSSTRAELLQEARSERSKARRSRARRPRPRRGRRRSGSRRVRDRPTVVAVGRRRRCAGSAGSRPDDGLEHEAAVVGGAAHRAEPVERPAQRHRAEPADPAVGRPQAGQAGPGGREDDRAAGVGADRERHEPCRPPRPPGRSTSRRPRRRRSTG